MLGERNIISICPYCGHDRGRPAQRAYKCKNCGNEVFVRRTPESRERKPVTYEEVERIETLWSDRRENRTAETLYDVLFSYIDAGLREMLEHPIPDLHYVQIIGHTKSAVPVCESCSALVGKLLTPADARKFKLLPNWGCKNVERAFFCLISYEIVFDDELPADFKKHLYKPPAPSLLNRIRGWLRD